MNNKLLTAVFVTRKQSCELNVDVRAKLLEGDTAGKTGRAIHQSLTRLHKHSILNYARIVVAQQSISGRTQRQFMVEQLA